MSHPIWQRDRLYSFLRPYVDATTRFCFTHVEVEGRDRIPKEGAVILAPNHRLTLMDALLILLLDQGPIAFGARSDIFRKPRIAAFLRWLRIVPIVRERDGIKSVARNLSTYVEISDCLSHGVPFCLFSEGTHRPERGMMAVKKGIFRIARTTEEKTGLPVWIVPVGIDSQYFFRVGGRVTLRIGEPFRPAIRPKEEDQRQCEELRSKVMELIDKPYPKREGFFLPAVLSFPVWIICAILASPIWIPYFFIIRKMKDRAWRMTVRFGLRLVLPIFQPFDIIFEALNPYYRDLWHFAKARWKKLRGRK